MKLTELVGFEDFCKRITKRDFVREIDLEFRTATYLFKTFNKAPLQFMIDNLEHKLFDKLLSRYRGEN